MVLITAKECKEIYKLLNYLDDEDRKRVRRLLESYNVVKGYAQQLKKESLLNIDYEAKYYQEKKAYNDLKKKYEKLKKED